MAYCRYTANITACTADVTTVVADATTLIHHQRLPSCTCGQPVAAGTTVLQRDLPPPRSDKWQRCVIEQ